ncbi:3826_t:CDS:2 [Funneliformis caledonium]|uniref:3826_t:CDS:1 n=1 Tax=Funneliformis caledonium TaxID=1117310 RepID=A0A9N8UZN1_9GLOM|nr:3826_t:CDS:2 [Funneliformis caledonium]
MGRTARRNSEQELFFSRQASRKKNNLCAKCKKEESFDGRWIRCDKCTLWYHTACVRIQLNDNGEFYGDYYCQLCTGVPDPIVQEFRPSEEDCEPNSRLSPSSSTSSSSGASGPPTKKFKTGSSHPTPTQFPLSPSTSTPMEMEIMKCEMGKNNKHNHNLNHIHHNSNNNNDHGVEETPKKKKCKLQKHESPLRPSNVNVEIHRLFETSKFLIPDKPISRPYDWPNPVPYSRAVIRMSQIREFILTHCPKAAAVGIIDDSQEHKPKSLQIAEDLWKKLDSLEQKYNQHNQV